MTTLTAEAADLAKFSTIIRNGAVELDRLEKGEESHKLAKNKIKFAMGQAIKAVRDRKLYLSGTGSDGKPYTSLEGYVLDQFTNVSRRRAYQLCDYAELVLCTKEAITYTENQVRAIKNATPEQKKMLPYAESGKKEWFRDFLREEMTEEERMAKLQERKDQAAREKIPTRDVRRDLESIEQHILTLRREIRRKRPWVADLADHDLDKLLADVRRPEPG